MAQLFKTEFQNKTPVNEPERQREREDQTVKIASFVIYRASDVGRPRTNQALAE